MNKEKLAEIESKLTKQRWTAEEIAKIELVKAKVRGKDLARVFQHLKCHNFRDIAAFLGQTEFFWRLKDNKPFYKYVSPCAKAREDDTWEEDLVMSYKEINSVLNVISTRVQGKKNAEELSRTGTTLNTLVVRYVDAWGVTHWYVNERLLLSLRSYALKHFFNLEKATKYPAEQVDQISSGATSSYSEGLQKDKEEKEKLNKKEKEESLDLQDLAVSHDISKPLTTDSKKAENMVKASKPVKAKTVIQQKIIQESGRAVSMPLDFQVKSATITEAVNQGYPLEQVETLAVHFKNWYTNSAKGRKWKVLNWDLEFLSYLAFQHQKGSIAKNGETKPSANNDRVGRLRELATGSVFDRVGTTDFAELGRRLRNRSS